MASVPVFYLLFFAREFIYSLIIQMGIQFAATENVFKK